MADSAFVTRENYNVGGHMTGGRQGVKIDRIVIHHNAATTDVIPGVWQNRAASAHYQVTPGYITQCVAEGNTAWHAGNYNMNLRSIGIEHLNATGAPSWTVADATIERSAHLVADICRRRGIPCDRGHIIKHSEVKSTACPGGLDIDRLVNRARELMGEKPVTPSTPVQVEKPSSSGGGWLYFDVRGNVRNEPNTQSGIFATYDAGTWVRYDGWVYGENVSGNNKWLRSSRSKKYVWSGITGGTFNLPFLGGSAPANAPSASGLVPQRATYKATANMIIRSQPRVAGDTNTGYTLNNGQTVVYDGYIDANGYRWISYIGYSGNRRYIARRNFATGEIYGQCY